MHVNSTEDKTVPRTSFPGSRRVLLWAVAIIALSAIAAVTGLVHAAWARGLTALAGLGLVWLAYQARVQTRPPDLIALGVAAGLGWLAIDLIDIVRPLGHAQGITTLIDALTAVTFSACAFLLSLVASDIVVDPSTHELGAAGFNVFVWGPCSGIEGFVLITVFLSGYILLLRQDFRFPHVLILFPIGIFLSWCLNVVRITTLILLGAHVSPQLAIDTFHSHAGWLMFTILAVASAWALSRIQWLRKPAGGGAQMSTAKRVESVEIPDFFEDPITARIIPFIVLIAGALLAQTFFGDPSLAYPLRAVAMAGALYLFRAELARLDRSMDALAIACGVAVGLAWLLTHSGAPSFGVPLPDVFVDVAPIWAAVWVVSRVLGTVVLVPIIEELFFRGYVFARLDGPGWRRGMALLGSSGLFAILHERWLAAFLAGIVFALVYLRRGRLIDAILCHVVANALIAIWALWRWDFSII